MPPSNACGESWPVVRLGVAYGVSLIGQIRADNGDRRRLEELLGGAR